MTKPCCPGDSKGGEGKDTGEKDAKGKDAEGRPWRSGAGLIGVSGGQQ